MALYSSISVAYRFQGRYTYELDILQLIKLWRHEIMWLPLNCLHHRQHQLNSTKWTLASLTTVFHSFPQSNHFCYLPPFLCLWSSLGSSYYTMYCLFNIDFKSDSILPKCSYPIVMRMGFASYKINLFRKIFITGHRTRSPIKWFIFLNCIQF